MPLNIDPKLIDALVQRQVALEETQHRTAPKASTLSPNLVSVLGSVADGASTYHFLSKGEGSEGNALLGGLSAKPLPAALGAAGMGIGAMALASLMRKKFPHLADTLQGGLASRQFAIGLENTMPNNKSSDQSVTEKIAAAITR